MPLHMADISFDNSEQEQTLSFIQSYRVTLSGPVADPMTITCHVIEFKPEASAKWDVLRPVSPDEPDSDTEKRFSVFTCMVYEA